MKQYVKIGVGLVVVAMLASVGWSQERPVGRQPGLARLAETGEYLSIVLLLDKETAAKVKGVYEEENSNLTEALRQIRQSGGDDREAIRAKQREEREKSAGRIKEGLKGILSEGQIREVEPILAISAARRDPYLWALASIELNPDQRVRLLGVTVPYAVKMGSPTGEAREGRGTRQAQREEEIQKQMEDFRTAAGAILTADQKKQWEDQAAQLQEKWDKEREQRRQRAGRQEQGERSRRGQ